jgi:hypothetical protein
MLLASQGQGSVQGSHRNYALGGAHEDVGLIICVRISMGNVDGERKTDGPMPEFLDHILEA